MSFTPERYPQMDCQVCKKRKTRHPSGRCNKCRGPKPPV